MAYKIPVPKGAGDFFEKGNNYHCENSMTLAYGLHDTTKADVQKVCDRATESYAREILDWPNSGRFDKPDIFKADDTEGELKSLEDCTKRFVNHLAGLFQSSPPYDLPTYPHAFIVIDGKAESVKSATLVIAHQPDEGERWQVEHCSVLVHVELGLAVESLRMGDIPEQDLLGQQREKEQT
ncbi:hypothetical protein F53441_9246 [Fusarium austroafricanum]|uniref:Uncharacterized protein n=1 Tax=Fusarium austroafricanum TaxID=2364996 RepID=A0A8H4KC79_9HYPO|nr:hypothetical protein F53441_9246 [Fusarium austroafricanum]